MGENEWLDAKDWEIHSRRHKVALDSRERELEKRKKQLEKGEMEFEKREIEVAEREKRCERKRSKECASLETDVEYLRKRVVNGKTKKRRAEERKRFEKDRKEGLENEF